MQDAGSWILKISLENFWNIAEDLFANFQRGFFQFFSPRTYCEKKRKSLPHQTKVDETTMTLFWTTSCSHKYQHFRYSPFNAYNEAAYSPLKKSKAVSYYLCTYGEYCWTVISDSLIEHDCEEARKGRRMFSSALLKERSGINISVGNTEIQWVSSSDSLNTPRNKRNWVMRGR